jgi:hypothetical protein
MQGGFLLLTAKQSPSRNQIQVRKLWEKAVKYFIAFCAAANAGEKESFDLILNLKYSIHTVQFRCPPHYPSFSWRAL